MSYTTANSAAKQSPAEIIAGKIIEMLDSGVSPWHQPWKCMGVPQSIDKRPYRGINALLLGMQPYRSPYYLTFNRCKALGGSVMKGQKGHYVVFWDRISKKEKADDGTETVRSFFLLRGYTVFNVEQCSGLPAKFYPQENSTEFVEHADAQAVWDGYAGRPDVLHDSRSAYYSPKEDRIHLPAKADFDSVEEYYSTLFHEGSHSTGAPSRLARLKWDGFGSESYSREELVAEISAQILCQHVGITRTLANAAAYCKSWASHLRGENAREIVGACTQAQKAADYILGVKADAAQDEEE